MRLLRAAFLAVMFVLSATAASFAQDGGAPDEAALRTIIAKFAGAKRFSDTSAIVEELAATGEPVLAGVLEALARGDLMVRESDSAVFIATGRGRTLALIDPLSGESVGEAGKRELEKVKVNNGLRRTIRDAVGTLTLSAKDPAVRLKAANTLVENPDPDSLAAIETALEREQDGIVAARLTEARAAAILFSDRPEAEIGTAIDSVAALGTRNALSMLTKYEASAQGELKERAAAAMATVESTLAMWDVGQNVWYGVSLGSVLLLAAIGLAITFGVMGVINMAHGEMVMLGAYSTFMVQEIMRNSAPGLLDWSLAIALPLAFLVAGTVGFAMERGIIRFLYGRPLETLLATWGVSLILQQTVRTIFGPTNREVSNPSWMSGAFELGQMTITWNRLYIVIFSLVVFAVLLWSFNRTSMGLRMRAVTQNRRMAAAMGIRTPWIDAMTFALGSGIAGMAGVALSQIDNVSPNLGQSYIIDSFMVV
ncbi:MAG: urea ABC transporter permease subunit UrtB, partial [Pseudomonadota bacterium]|nr:urea ABC transporter permease subunit UrtB [Pseudomonadota bacterium]